VACLVGTLIATASIALLILPFFSTFGELLTKAAFLEWLGRTFRFGPYAFKVPVGETEAWLRRES
jgi:hypothetical protein